MATLTHIADGLYRVADESGGQTLVYIAGTPGDWWAFCDGQIYRERGSPGSIDERLRQQSGESRRTSEREAGHYELTAPMPATVVKVLVTPGQAVRQGESLVLLEAMKMELPLRAPANAVVQRVNCHEGELVQPDRTLVELT